jgi:DNA-directed RNA polymerase specialized sigma24 family protein
MADCKLLTDEELIVLLKQGNGGSFTEIYQRYSMTVYYRVNQLLRDSEAAKDIVQELFMTLWDKADHINDDANLAGTSMWPGVIKYLN